MKSEIIFLIFYKFFQNKLNLGLNNLTYRFRQRDSEKSLKNYSENADSTDHLSQIENESSRLRNELVQLRTLNELNEEKYMKEMSEDISAEQDAYESKMNSEKSTAPFLLTTTTATTASINISNSSHPCGKYFSNAYSSVGSSAKLNLSSNSIHPPMMIIGKKRNFFLY